MTNTIVPYVPTTETISAIDALVKKAVQSGMTKTKNPADAFFVVMYGLELGIPPMTALRTIYSVNGGAPTCSGEAMLALIRRSGKVKVAISSNADTLAAGRATVHMKRTDSGDEFTATWGKEDDNRAGLRSNRDKYPAQMWTWRAVSIAGKALCSDIIGALYTFEEINPDIPVDEDGAPTVDLDTIDATFTVESPPVITSSQIAAPEKPATPKNPPPVVTAQQSANEGYKASIGLVFNAVRGLYDAPKHMQNSIAALEEKGTLKPEMTVDQAIAVIKAHKAAQQQAAPVAPPASPEWDALEVDLGGGKDIPF